MHEGLGTPSERLTTQEVTVPVLESLVDTSTPTFKENREALLALLCQHEAQVDLARAGGGEPRSTTAEGSLIV